MHLKKRRKMPFWAKLLLSVLAVFAVVIIAAVIFINSKLDLVKYDTPDTTFTPISSTESKEADEEEGDIVDISGLEERAPSELPSGEIQKEKDIFNILLLGTDERTYDFSDAARADAIMILSLNLKDSTAKLVSLERGMGVPILEGEYEGQYDWLTHCFRYGGAELMVKEVQTCFNLDVESYMRVNFTALKDIVDVLGGVDVTLTGAEYPHIKGTATPLGDSVFHLDGTAALSYCRLRSIDSDWSRIKRQRTVIQACADGVKNADVATLNNLIDTILPMIRTNLTKLELVKLMSYAPNFLGVEFDQMTIPVPDSYGGMLGMEGRSLFAVDFETNSQILHDFLYENIKYEG